MFLANSKCFILWWPGTESHSIAPSFRYPSAGFSLTPDRTFGGDAHERYQAEGRTAESRGSRESRYRTARRRRILALHRARAANGRNDDPQSASTGDKRPHPVPKFPEGVPVSTADQKTTRMMLADAAAIAEQTGKEIAAKFCDLGTRERRSLVLRFRRQLFPASKPGRRRSGQITAACSDWNAGMRGVALYRKNIPGYDRMGHWQRKVKTRALMDAIRARRRREQPRTATPIIPPARLPEV